jgi:hypothetical protein
MKGELEGELILTLQWAVCSLQPFNCALQTENCLLYHKHGVAKQQLAVFPKTAEQGIVNHIDH